MEEKDMTNMTNMKQRRGFLLGALCLALVVPALAQTPTATASALPRLVRFGGAVKGPDGGALTGVVGITFSLYAEQTGGAPLWQETQNLTADSNGHYSALLGSTRNEGLPAELFITEQAHWVGVQVQGQPEQPRVLLVSSPYALKAGDAETLGGKPASAYLLAGPPASGQPEGPSGATQPAQPSSAASATAAAVAPSTTTTNYIPKFTSTAGALGNSAIYQKGGNVGVGTKTPAATLEVNGNAQVDGNVASSGTVSGNVVNAATSLNIQGSAEIQDGNTGNQDFAAGYGAGFGTGNGNTAVGVLALFESSGSSNTGVGYGAIGGGGCFVGNPGCTSGSNNTAVGNDALSDDTTGGNNTATGHQALFVTTTGSDNAAFGQFALHANVTGSNNAAVGHQALYSSGGNSNIAIGNEAGFNITGSGNIDIGNAGGASDSGAIRIGCYVDCSDYSMGTQTTAFIAGIYGVNAGGIPVYINSSGQLGTVSSSRRYKEDIQDMADASSGLMRLRPVTFRYKKPFSDGSQPMQYGLIAEEVAEVYPDLVARSADGQIETVKYQLLDPMLLNELQKQNTTIAAQAQQISSLEGRMAKLEAALERTASAAGSR
jgi:hypothetical protein